MSDIAERRRDAYSEVGLVRRETRDFRAELRSNDDGGLHFDGMASTYETPYVIEDLFGEYEETFADGSFSRTLAERDDVVLLINHEGLPLARYPGTLDLREETQRTPSGLRAQSDLEPTDPDVLRIKPKMDRGDLTQMSIAFRAMRQEWNEDYTQRKILEARLYDVSIVTNPANPFTSAGLRGLDALRALSTDAPDTLLVAARSTTGAALSDENLRALIDGARANLDELEAQAFGASGDQPEALHTIGLDVARRTAEVLDLEVLDFEPVG